MDKLIQVKRIKMVFKKGLSEDSLASALILRVFKKKISLKQTGKRIILTPPLSEKLFLSRSVDKDTYPYTIPYYSICDATYGILISLDAEGKKALILAGFNFESISYTPTIKI